MYDGNRSHGAHGTAGPDRKKSGHQGYAGSNGYKQHKSGHEDVRGNVGEHAKISGVGG